MKTALVLPLLAAVLVASTMSGLVPDRAPALITSDDCECQCDGTTYLDENDIVQGNCRSADSSGRKWCYISPDQITMDACKDAFDHDSRYNMSRSFAACSSPDPYSEDCNFVYED